MEKRLSIFLVISMLTLLTACGNGQEDSTDGYSAPSDKPDEPVVTGEVQAMQELESDATGPYLADSEGMALYYFTEDEVDTSNCTDDCLVNWPALTAAEVEVPEGYDREDFNTIIREDNGEEQVTFKGYPLYYFINDADEGDVNGQGVNDVWFTVNNTTEFPE